MANNNNESVDNNPDNSKDAGLDKSFVGKFVSGILNSTPLSKWFGKDAGPTSKPSARRREEDEELEDSSTFQPPSKRAKLPANVEHNNYSAHVFESPVTVHNSSNNVNSVSSKVCRKFPEPSAGPSGLKSRKLFEKHDSASTNTLSSNSFENQVDLVNGDNDSDSEISTSGYSSAPKLVNKQKSSENSCATELCERITPKTRSLFTSTHNPNGNRSLFAEKSPQMNTSLSSRRPAFNASTFGSPNFVDRTLTTRRILNSPFYSGQTMYGGASACGRRYGRSAEDPKLVTRTSVQIKPVNEKPNSQNATLSKTARRILSTLEQYSTPISDAKKIPVSPRRPAYGSAAPYVVRDRKKPSAKELQVPSVPDLLQMKQKERLQNSTETVRQIATKSKSDLNKEEYRLRSEEDKKQKHSYKMKGSGRQAAQEEELVKEVKLPKVSLPITTLPKFDVVLAPPGGTTEAKKSESGETALATKSSIIKPIIVDKKETQKRGENGKTSSYTFSDPLVISRELKSVAAMNCFKFSEPVYKKSKDACQSLESRPKADTSKLKNNGDNVSSVGVAKPDTGKTKWECHEAKQECDRWKCGSCMVHNNNTLTKCVSCGSVKPKEKPSTPSGFGDTFKPPASTWECSTCLIRNKNEAESCAACGMAKTGKATTILTFGNQFRPANDTWECPVCMIRNKNVSVKCAACETSKPDLKDASTQKTADNGSPKYALTCMIKTSNDPTKRAAFEVPKEGGEPANKGFGEAFKMKAGEWECASCMVKNKSTSRACVCCGVVRPGGSSEKLAEISKSEEEKKPVNSFNFGIDKSCSVTNFKFGIPTSKPEADVAKTEVAASSTTFTFGIKPQEEITKTVSSAPTVVVSNPLLKPEEKLPEEAKPAPVGFKFGIDNSTNKINNDVNNSSTKTVSGVSGGFETKTSMPMFEFKPPAVNGDINKSKDNVFDKESNKSDTTIFGADTNKPKETVFGAEITKTQETPFSNVNKSAISPFSKLSKPSDSPFSSNLPKSESPFSKIKPVNYPFGNITKPLESSFGSNSSTKQTSSLFGNVNKRADSPFGNPPDAKKPKESLFGASSDVAKTQGIVFGKVNDTSKPQESIFGAADTNKPKEGLFGNKPSESNNIFSTSTMTSGFSFTPKPAENAPSSSISATPPVFKFGADSTQNTVPVKKFGEPSDSTVSNGFGSLQKMPAFGTHQCFGASSDNKPFGAPESRPFGSTESKPFSFGSTDSAPKNASFSFGQTDKPTAPAPAVFNFGSAAATAAAAAASTASSNAPSTGFNFSVPSSGFNFGSTTKVESTPFNPPNNIFGSAGTGAKNGSFNFGSSTNNNNQKAVFTFGANQTTQPTQPGFQTQPTFNFSAQSQPVNVPGNFNFSGPPPTFNFTEGSSATGGRKFKRAVRRTAPR